MPQGGKLTFALERRQVTEVEAKENVGATPGDYVLIAIADTGSGIPPEIIDKIFDPFFTTKPRGQGTGLGLSTVHGIVRSSGGFIKVRSELGHGTEFQVYFPAVPEPQAEGTSKSAHPFAAGQGELVLVVDDEATILEVTRLILEQNGYTCLVASDGAAALELFKANRARIKAVIIDRMMPGMNGEAAAKLMHELAPDLPIFLATGLVGDKNVMEDEAALLACGIRSILKKPFSEHSLLQLLRESLQRAPADKTPPASA
jgi:CheY-like chemotaxis protein